MSNTPTEEEIDLYEHYFRDPKLGDAHLRPPYKGLACFNIRVALHHLGFDLPITKEFDETLGSTIKEFQAKYKHTYVDGVFGRGTRRLLTRVLLEWSPSIFERLGLVSPEYAVFLSYSRGDEQLVTGIAQGLRAQGIPVFQDKEAIPSGQYWPDVLFRSIQKCQVFLCLISENACESVNVLIEVALATHAPKKILPVFLEPVILPKAFQALIGGIQHLDLSAISSTDQRVKEITQVLSQLNLCPGMA